MKRKIIWIALALLVIGAAVVAVLLLTGDKEQDMETPTNDAGLTHLQLLKLNNVSELEEYVQNNDLILQTSDDDSLTSVGGVPISGYYMTLYFQADENGEFYRVDGMLDFFLENKKVGDLKTVFDKFCDAVAELLGIEKSFNYSVYAADGYEIDSTSDESVQMILDGQAEFSLSAIDVDGSYWNAIASVDEADRVMFSFFHSFDYDEALYGSGENIVLASPAGTEE